MDSTSRKMKKRKKSGKTVCLIHVQEKKTEKTHKTIQNIDVYVSGSCLWTYRHDSHPHRSPDSRKWGLVFWLLLLGYETSFCQDIQSDIDTQIRLGMRGNALRTFTGYRRRNPSSDPFPGLPLSIAHMGHVMQGRGQIFSHG